MRVLRFIAVLIAVTVIVTVAVLTALFTFWSFVPVQPGTATALLLLFIIAPGTGIAAGIMAAIGADRRSTASATGASGEPAGRQKWLGAALWAVIGGLAGYGGTKAALDLIYTDRWSNPESAPSWLPLAPPLAAIVLAVLLALAFLRYGTRAVASRSP